MNDLNGSALNPRIDEIMQLFKAQTGNKPEGSKIQTDVTVDYIRTKSGIIPRAESDAGSQQPAAEVFYHKNKRDPDNSANRPGGRADTIMDRFKENCEAIDRKHPQISISGQTHRSAQERTGTGKHHFYNPSEQTINNKSFQHNIVCQKNSCGLPVNLCHRMCRKVCCFRLYTVFLFRRIYFTLGNIVT